MASLPETVRTLLEADSTLTTALTGGIWDESELPRDGLPGEATVFTTQGRLKPVMVLRWGGDGPYGGLSDSGRQSLDVWVYQDTNYDTIRTVLRRVKVLLHRKSHDTDERSPAWSTWAGNLGETIAPELGDAPVNRSRFQFVYKE